MSIGNEPREGMEIAGCEIERVIGRGGMGVVYLAHQHKLDRDVALKLITPELAEDEGFRSRFEREARVTAALDHPHVVPVYEAGEDGGALYLTMRHVDGQDLRELIAREGRLEPKRAAEIVSQVAEALDEAHERGLIHRDVKPANVLLEEHDGDDHAYLTDFGLTKAAESVSGTTKSGQWVGTIDYVTPEQISGEPGDASTDTYALGCVLYEALTGELPYARETDAARMWAHMNDPIPSAREVVPELPKAVDKVLERALAKKPEDRFASTGEFGAAAIAAVEGKTVKSSSKRARRKDAAHEATPSDATTRIDEKPAVEYVDGVLVEEQPAAAAKKARPRAGRRRTRRVLGAVIGVIAFAAIAAAGVYVALQARPAPDTSDDVTRAALTATHGGVTDTAAQADSAGKLDEIRALGVAAQDRLGIVNRKLDALADVKDPKYRIPARAALTAESKYLTALGGLRAMGDRDLRDWRDIRPRVEAAQVALQRTRGRVIALGLGAPATLLPEVPTLRDGTISLDRVIRRAGTKLRRWQIRLKKAKIANAGELASLNGYAGTMRGYLERYSGLRAEMQNLSNEINAGTTYDRAYQGLGDARTAREGILESIKSLSPPPASAAPQSSVASVIGESVQALDDAIAGVATYQSDFEGEYFDYQDTPGWQNYLTASDRISGEFSTTRGAWESSIQGQIDAVKARDLPAKPDV
jgi:Protein kinase domain